MKTNFDDAFDAFENGNFSIAWSLVKDSELGKCDGSEDSEHTRSAALKACLLSAWWGLHELSLAIVNQLHKRAEMTDPVTSFLLTYAHMSRGEMPPNDTLRDLLAQDSRKLSQWMQVELLGRTRRYQDQLNFLESLNTSFKQQKNKLENP